MLDGSGKFAGVAAKVRPLLCSSKATAPAVLFGLNAATMTMLSRVQAGDEGGNWAGAGGVGAGGHDRVGVWL